MSKKTKQQKHQERMASKEQHATQVAEAAHEHDDDMIVAPKGMSRRRFLFTLGITIFVVLAFVIPSALMSTLGGGAGDGTREYVTWTRPDGTRGSLSVRDFLTRKQAYNRLLSGIFGQRQSITDEDAAAYLLDDELSANAGVVVTDKDLRTFLADQLQFDSTTFDNFARSNRMTVAELQTEIRRWLRVQRYRTFLLQGVRLPDTERIESQWKDQFREYKFDYVRANAEDFEDAARAAVPDDTALQAWFDALPQFQKNNFLTERKMAAEFVTIALGGLDQAAKLRESFPPAENLDEEVASRTYYDLVKATRFQKPAPEEEEGDEEAEDKTPEDLTIPYEEVEALCKAEMPTYNALRDWMQSIAIKANDPAQEFDFKAEAEIVGLTVNSDGVARTQAEWEEAETVGNNRIANMLRFSGEGALLPAITATENALIVGRCTAIENPAMPEFADMREDVVDAWVETARGDQALEKLNELFLSFLENPEDKPAIGGIDVEDQAFTDAVTAAGLEVVSREWRDREQPPPGGFADAEPIELFLRQNPTSYILQDNQIAEPTLAADRKNAFLVRLIGSREPELVKMKPAYIRNIESNLVNTTMSAFTSQAFGFDAYAARYDLELHPLEEQPAQ